MSIHASSRDSRGRSLSSVEIGINALRRIEPRYILWKTQLDQEFGSAFYDPLTIWNVLPDVIRQKFSNFEKTCPRALERTSALLESIDLLQKWELIEKDRTEVCSTSELMAEPTINRISVMSTRRKLSPPPVAVETLAAANESSKLTISPPVAPVVLRQSNIAEHFIENHPICTVVLALIAVGTIGGWFFSPFGWLPVIFSGTLITNWLYRLITNKQSSLFIPAATIVMVCFICAGIIHDIYFDPQPTAQCADGSYSYSEHHSGTCSWHHGVIEWNPKLHHWWQNFVER